MIISFENFLLINLIITFEKTNICTQQGHFLVILISVLTLLSFYVSSKSGGKIIEKDFFQKVLPSVALFEYV